MLHALPRCWTPHTQHKYYLVVRWSWARRLFYPLSLLAAMRRSLVALILPLSAALQLPTLNGARRAVAPPPPPLPPPPPPAELALQYSCAVGWLGLSVSSLTAARPLVNDVFGLSQTTFEQCVKEPAGGGVGSRQTLLSASGSSLSFPIRAHLSACASTSQASSRSPRPSFRSRRHCS